MTRAGQEKQYAHKSRTALKGHGPVVTGLSNDNGLNQNDN